MKKFSTVELLRDIKTVTMAADRQPVAITQHRNRGGDHDHREGDKQHRLGDEAGQ